MKTLYNEDTITEDFPWIVFRLGTNQYAINSRRVSSITQLSGTVTSMPDTPAYMRGLLSLRGSTIPLFDLRLIFGKDTLLEEYQVFSDMLEHRKQDHLHWAKELRHSIENTCAFTLTTDPHQCEFGRWYDHYHDNRSSVNFQLKKIDKPHKRLHHAAVLVQEAASLTDPAERDAKLHTIIEEMETKDIPEIVSLLDETTAALKSSIRELVLVLGEDDSSIGYIVDEVVAVQKLEPINETESLDAIFKMQYVIGISQNEEGLILKLDENILGHKMNWID